MADQHQHQHHRPHRLSVPARLAPATTFSTVTPRSLYPLHPQSSSTPTPSSSKRNLSLLYSKSSRKSSISLLFFLLLSLRSLYSLLPFLRSSPSFSLFPFSFLVSLFSFLLTLCFSFFGSQSSSIIAFRNSKQNQSVLSLSSVTLSQHKALGAKSILLAATFLLRFQALRYCGTAAMILAELSGNVAALFLANNQGNPIRNRSYQVRGFLAMFLGLSFLSISWDRIECFPFTHSFIDKYGWAVFPRDNCLRLRPMLLPFLSGFLSFYGRLSMNWGAIKQLGHKRARLISLLYTTLVLFIPAAISILLFSADFDGVAIGALAWPLANTVLFGVLLNEIYSDDKLVSSKDFRSEFIITFLCTLVLELIYFPELSLWGLLFCGLLLYVSVSELNPFYSKYLELGIEPSESFTTSVMKPIRHILSQRKSRKIALFLLINTAYMVVEFVAGFMSNSLGLISDACHMLFDCAALAIGLYASYISRFPANSEFNYGRGRFEVLSGYANAVFLVLVGVLIVLESFERILDPQEISTNSLLSVSIGGLLVNVIGLIFFHEEHHHAHGGTGSCSHSHNHSIHQPEHGHETDGKNQNVKAVDHGHNAQHHGHHGDHQKHHDHGHHHAHKCHDHGHHKHPHDTGHTHDCKPGNHDHGSHESHQLEETHNLDSCFESKTGSSLRKYDQNSDGEKLKKHHHKHIDHNMEGIFLHVLADTMGSVGVVISTLLIKYKGWLAADPACSIFISVMIISSVIPLLRNSAEILLQRVPRSNDHEVREALADIAKMRGICGIHDFHIWSFTNTDVVGTIQLHVSADSDQASIKSKVAERLHNSGVNDLTLQVEYVR